MHSEDSLPLWYIYGAGGLGLETVDILLDAIDSGMQEPHQVCFLVDNPESGSINGMPVVSSEKVRAGSRVTIAVGEPALRSVLLAKAKGMGLIPSTIVSPKAFVSPLAAIGSGSIVAPFASIQSLAVVRDNVSINTQAIIGHHVSIGHGAVISSQVNLGGSCTVGDCSYIGMGACILEGICVGSWSVLGMGSVLYKDIPDEMIALGNPARAVRKNEERKVFK